MARNAKWIKGAFIKCRCGKPAEGIIHGEDNNRGETISKKVIAINCKNCGLQIKAPENIEVYDAKTYKQRLAENLTLC